MDTFGSMGNFSYFSNCSSGIYIHGFNGGLHEYGARHWRSLGNFFLMTI